MTRFRLLAPLFALLIASLSGCSTLMQGAPLPEGFSVRDITRADAGTPFAVSQSGTFATIAKGALQMVDPPGQPREIARGAAFALCFSPDGNKLAAALPAGEGSLLRLFDREGKALGEATLPARVTGLAWRSERQLVALTVAMKKYSFGSLLSTRLHQWDGTSDPIQVELTSVTVRPKLAKLPEETLYDSYGMALSPFGDEIAYGSLKDPPMFPPYQRIAIRHLESGVEKDVAVTAVGSGAPVYTPDGESLLVGNAHGLTRKLTLPEGKETSAWPSHGSHPAVSPSGAYVFLDGKLYHEEKTLISFPEQSKAAFLRDGTGLAVSFDGKLYLVTGLNDKPAPTPAADLGQLLQLRRLRSLGLISEQEYKKQKGAARP